MDISWRDIILIGGGLFLIAKATHEIHREVEARESEPAPSPPPEAFAWIVVQLVVIDLVFSLDSIITAIGMAEDLEVMIAAVVIAMIVMYVAAGPVGAFIAEHPTTKMLALAFLVLIGVALVADGFEFHIPRGYIYFAMAFAGAVEAFNVMARRNRRRRRPPPDGLIHGSPERHCRRRPVRGACKAEQGVTTMVAAVRVHKTGGPEVLTYEDIDVPAPGPGPDQASRTMPAASISSTPISACGMYPSPVACRSSPATRGPARVDRGRAGRDRHQGRRPRRLYVGARGLRGRAAAAGRPGGEAAGQDQLRAGRRHDAQGHDGRSTCCDRTFKVQKGDNVLIHAAAGGVGLIACQWANHLGANVIGTVGSKDKAELAKANGAHHIILYRDEDFVAKVKEITGGKLCEVVYDGVGKATFPASLDCIKPLGMFVSFGTASGPIEAFNINILQTKGSLFCHPSDAQHLCRQARGLAQDRE